LAAQGKRLLWLAARNCPVRRCADTDCESVEWTAQDRNRTMIGHVRSDALGGTETWSGSMWCVRVATLSSAGLLLAVHAASAGSGWYVAGSAGASWRLDASRATQFSNGLGATGPGTSTTSFDPGPVVNLAVGHALPLGFRVEAELGYAHYAVAGVSPLSSDGAFPELTGKRLALQSGGGRASYSATINAFYDLPVAGPVVPFVGAGFGVTHNDGEAAHFAGAGGRPRFSQSAGSATDAVVLAEFGVTIPLDAAWSVVPSYAFAHVVSPGSALANDTSIFRLGLRYTF
jgi:opacity protein-like surface antigen